MKKCKKMFIWEYKEVLLFEFGFYFWFGLFYLEILLCCLDWFQFLGIGNFFDLIFGFLSLFRVIGINIVFRKGLFYFVFRF